MDGAPTTSFVHYWRRTDVPHLTLYDRIYWVMQWVYNDPLGELNGGRLATARNATRELVWIAATYGQEAEPQTTAFDEMIRRRSGEGASRAGHSNMDRIGSSDKKSRSPSGDCTLSSQPKYSRDAADDDDNMSSRSETSSAAVSSVLREEEVRDPPQHRIGDDGISLQTIEDARQFKRDYYSRSKGDCNGAS
ncbi:hypothetical protein CF319_g7511 [Tilletia indica]|nr:hypothetical protein CF319_g7511 [Tilletia indica]